MHLGDLVCGEGVHYILLIWLATELEETKALKGSGLSPQCAQHENSSGEEGNINKQTTSRPRVTRLAINYGEYKQFAQYPARTMIRQDFFFDLMGGGGILHLPPFHPEGRGRISAASEAFECAEMDEIF